LLVKVAAQQLHAARHATIFWREIRQAERVNPSAVKSKRENPSRNRCENNKKSSQGAEYLGNGNAIHLFLSPSLPYLCSNFSSLSISFLSFSPFSLSFSVSSLSFSFFIFSRFVVRSRF
jgi:hypothetical protein